MRLLKLSALTLGLLVPALAVEPGGFEDGGDTLVSAMMMFVGNEDKVYVLDKAEDNPTRAPGKSHPAWASIWDIKSRTATPMDMTSNVFCASGMHLPNGSFVTFGGNNAVGRGGRPPNGDGWDSEYGNADGRKAIRIVNPCTDEDGGFESVKCRWYEDPTVLAMRQPRWYSTAEALADGTIVMIGGFTAGGYINRNYPNHDPNGAGSQNSYEFFPDRGEAVPFPFLTRTSGLNTFVHAFMMPSGRMFLQANVSTILWDYNTGDETPLPDMPKGIVRVYPASAAVAMLPLTPANKYNPTILFCGGTDMTDEEWGDFSFPRIRTWDKAASADCQRITPEPADKSEPVYEQDDDMPEGRTMGQFIILPDGKLLVLNGALYGTAGYAKLTSLVPDPSDMPVGESLADGPVFTPAIYDPNAPRGSRWTREGLQASIIPRMYHSSAMLLPDASVMVAGSNPNVDVNMTATFKTTYAAEIFYPPYFSSPVRPRPQGRPKALSYGGEPFDILIPADSYMGSSNDAAKGAIVAIIRGGFTTHAMNMGQRFLQLEHAYTVKADGNIILHVAQPPPDPNIFQPGPAFLYVTINGIPSNGSYVIVGSGRLGDQPLQETSVLPQSITVDDVAGKPSAEGGDQENDDKASNSPGSSLGGLGMPTIIGLAAGGVAALAIIGVIVLFVRRRRASTPAPVSQGGFGYGPVGGAPSMTNLAPGGYDEDKTRRESEFVPLTHVNHSETWSLHSSAKVHAPQYSPTGYGHQSHHPPYHS